MVWCGVVCVGQQEIEDNALLTGLAAASTAAPGVGGVTVSTVALRKQAVLLQTGGGHHGDVAGL